MVDVVLTPPAHRDFKTLQKKNPPVFNRIVAKLKTLPENPKEGKSLVGPFKGVRSLRVGSYRILYEVMDKKIYIYSIKHRSDAYR